MQQVLFENIEYSYLQKNALQRLRQVRQLVQQVGLDKQNIVQLEKGKCCIFPWMGTVAYRTLERLLNSYCRESLEITSIGGLNPYYLTIKLGKDKFKYLYPEIASLCEQRISFRRFTQYFRSTGNSKIRSIYSSSTFTKSFC